MKLNKRAKILVGTLALAGSVGLAGTAFTGTGVATTGNAAAPQFVGGSVSQSVTGATLSNIQYGFTNGTNTTVDEVTLTFADALADGQTASIVMTGTDSGTWVCSEIGDPTTMVSTCSGGTTSALTGIAVTVGSSQ